MGKRLSSVFKTSSIGEIILLLDSSVYTVVIYGDLNGLCSVYQYGHTPSRSVLLLPYMSGDRGTTMLDLLISTFIQRICS